MDRWVDLSKADFIGREAAMREQVEGPRCRRVSFVIEAEDADVMGDEPIWARVGKTPVGLIDAPHGHGAPRFDAAGNLVAANDPQIDGERRVVGWVTSGGYGHHVRASLAQGYVPTSLANLDEAGLFEIEILGIRRAARINRQALVDPDGARMRGVD